MHRSLRVVTAVLLAVTSMTYATQQLTPEEIQRHKDRIKYKAS